MIRRVREDSKGLFLNFDFGVYRPGPVERYSDVFDTGEGGLAAGDPVTATKEAGTPLLRIRTSAPATIWWSYSGPSNRGSSKPRD